MRIDEPESISFVVVLSILGFIVYWDFSKPQLSNPCDTDPASEDCYYELKNQEDRWEDAQCGGRCY